MGGGKDFAQNPIPILLPLNSVFFETPSTGNILSETMYILGIYVETGYVLSMCQVCTRNIYSELLILLSMLFMHHFVHTREYDYSNQVGVEPLLRTYERQAFLALHQGPIKYLKSWVVLRR